jgi:A/G-specific adenine glycosylase
MELGALLCTPAKPQCLICPVRAHCSAEAPELLPRKKPRRAPVDLEENCAWIAAEGHILLEQQTGRRWRGLWKLPPLAGSSATVDRTALLLELTYPFTHHRVRLSVYRSSAPPQLLPEQRWFRAAAESLPPMPSPHRRAVSALS